MANANIAFDQGGDRLRLGSRSGLNETTVEYIGLQHLLANSGTTDYVGWFDDFVGDSVDARWATTLSSGASINVPTAPLARGVVVFDTGATTNNAATLALGMNWLVSEGTLFFEARLTSHAALTHRVIEVGLSDALSETAGLAFSSHDATPTAVADNAVIFGYNTGDSMTTWSALAVKAAGTPQVSVLTSGLTAGQYQTFGIQVSSLGKATFYINQAEVASFDNAVAASALLTPWISVKTLTTSAADVRVDFVRLYQPVAR